MAKKYARIAGSEIHTEVLVTFRRNSDGTFTKIVNMPTRDWKTGTKRAGQVRPIETGPYVLTLDKSEADEFVTYEDLDKSIQYMYFKLFELDELKTEDEI